MSYTIPTKDPLAKSGESFQFDLSGFDGNSPKPSQRFLNLSGPFPSEPESDQEARSPTFRLDSRPCPIIMVTEAAPIWSREIVVDEVAEPECKIEGRVKTGEVFLESWELNSKERKAMEKLVSDLKF